MPDCPCDSTPRSHTRRWQVPNMAWGSCPAIWVAGHGILAGLSASPHLTIVHLTADRTAVVRRRTRVLLALLRSRFGMVLSSSVHTGQIVEVLQDSVT
jgi:hypothetical protein